MAEQRYQAVLAVISDGETVTDVAARFGVSRQTVHEWLAKYEAGGLEGLADRSHRPGSCPHQMSAEVEVAIAELRPAHPSWGPRRLVFELAKRGWIAGAVGVGGLSGVGAVEPDRPGRASAAGPEVEAVGTRDADGAVADGCRRRVRAGRWHPGQGVDRGR